MKIKFVNSLELLRIKSKCDTLDKLLNVVKTIGSNAGLIPFVIKPPYSESRSQFNEAQYLTDYIAEDKASAVNLLKYLQVDSPEEVVSLIETINFKKELKTVCQHATNATAKTTVFVKCPADGEYHLFAVGFHGQKDGKKNPVKGQSQNTYTIGEQYYQMDGAYTKNAIVKL